MIKRRHPSTYLFALWLAIVVVSFGAGGLMGGLWAIWGGSIVLSWVLIYYFIITDRKIRRLIARRK